MQRGCSVEKLICGFLFRTYHHGRVGRDRLSAWRGPSLPMRKVGVIGGPHCSLRPIIRSRQSGIWDCRVYLVEHFKRAILEHDMNRVGRELIKVCTSPERISDETDSWYSSFYRQKPARYIFVRCFRPAANYMYLLQMMLFRGRRPPSLVRGPWRQHYLIARIPTISSRFQTIGCALSLPRWLYIARSRPTLTPLPPSPTYLWNFMTCVRNLFGVEFLSRTAHPSEWRYDSILYDPQFWLFLITSRLVGFLAPWCLTGVY